MGTATLDKFIDDLGIQSEIWGSDNEMAAELVRAIAVARYAKNLQAENQTLRARIHSAREVYIGRDDVVTRNAVEGYLSWLARKMYDELTETHT